MPRCCLDDLYLFHRRGLGPISDRLGLPGPEQPKGSFPLRSACGSSRWILIFLISWPNVTSRRPFCYACSCPNLLFPFYPVFDTAFFRLNRFFPLTVFLRFPASHFFRPLFVPPPRDVPRLAHEFLEYFSVSFCVIVYPRIWSRLWGIRLARSLCSAHIGPLPGFSFFLGNPALDRPRSLLICAA